MNQRRSYAVITPARNEEPHLEALASCLAAQTLPPRRWIIVDNGSTDRTVPITRSLASKDRSITLLEISGERTPVRGEPVVRAFHAGVDALSERVDVVVKLDADVTFDPDFFEQVMDAFEQDQSLGITGGVCYEKRGDGSWAAVHVTRDHVRGATRAYRWQCLQDVLPLEPRIGWDGVDELKAQVRGWRTGTLPGVRFYHHRALAAREPTWEMWAIQGDMAHFMGYRPTYVMARALYRAVRCPSAIAMLWGYAAAVRARGPRCSDEQAIAHLRHQQNLRALPSRAREALGLS